MTKQRISVLILIASLGALSFALFSQYVQGHHPCELCIWQRWAYGAVILFSLIAVTPASRLGVASGEAWVAGMTISLLVLSTTATYHFGIEQNWWEGFQTCSAGFDGGSIEDIKDKLLNASLVKCDEPTWFLFGLSMAGWNVLYSGGLFLLSLFTLIKAKG